MAGFAAAAMAVEPAGPGSLATEAKAAQSYLEGWFGAPIVMPPIEIVRAPSAARDLPGHYVGGVIRVRPETLEKEAEIRRVLRHELTHAVIDERTRGNCPHWLQEGMAQFLDGTDIVLANARIRSSGIFVSLFRLEGPFQDLDPRSREQAYRQSASAVSFLVGRVGRPGLLALLIGLGHGKSPERALREDAGLSYTELQQAWEASLQPRSGVKKPIAG